MRSERDRSDLLRQWCFWFELAQEVARFCVLVKAVVQPVPLRCFRCTGVEILARHRCADCCNQKQGSCQNACGKYFCAHRSYRSFVGSTPSGIGDCFQSDPRGQGETSIFCHCHFGNAVMLTPEHRAASVGNLGSIARRRFRVSYPGSIKMHVATNSVRIYIQSNFWSIQAPPHRESFS